MVGSFNDHDLEEEDEEEEEIVVKPQKRDSGIDLSEKRVKENKTNVKIKNKKQRAEKMGNGSDINFKSGMIFDLEM